MAQRHIHTRRDEKNVPGKYGRAEKNIYEDIVEIEASIGYTFNDKELLVRALTHSSYVNEHNLTRLDCNERLEFLGDAVLEMVSSEFLYSYYPQSPEGELTKKRASLVSESPLAGCAMKLGIGSWLRLAKGADDGGGRTQPSILSDAVESIIGAIFLDSGINAARAFILSHVLYDPEERKGLVDSKTELQEIVQGPLGIEPEYVLVSATGPDHERTFVSRVLIAGKVAGEGSGRSKKQSEQAAAAQAISRYKQNGELF